jgi:hypothetical protein
MFYHVDLAEICTLYNTLECVNPNMLLMTAIHTDLLIICRIVRKYCVTWLVSEIRDSVQVGLITYRKYKVCPLL